VRSGDVAVYKKSKVSFGITCSSFELIVVQKIPTMVIFGKKVKAHEKYPANEQWGSHGWTFTNEAEALDRFKQLKATLSTK
jgi:hypothetical protein